MAGFPKIRRRHPRRRCSRPRPPPRRFPPAPSSAASKTPGRRGPRRDRHRDQHRHPVLPRRRHRHRGAVHPAAAAGRQLHGRIDDAGLQELLADRHRRSRSAATPASTRPSSSATSPEVVSIVADAPLVETSTGALSRTVGQNEVLNLPLVNRDLYSLLSLTGGVTSNDNSNSLGGPEQLTTINGSSRAQMGSVNFQLDGGNNTAGLRGTGNPAPNPGGGAGIPRPHQRLCRRVRPLRRRRRRRRHQVGHQRVARRRVRVLPQREAEREALGAAGDDGDQGSARSQPVRRRASAVR